MTDCPAIVIDIPVPPSVNKMRRWNKAAQPIIDAWVKHAHGVVTASRTYKRELAIDGPYELRIVLNEAMCRSDPDNVVKAGIDYLRRIELIRDDSPRYARRITIEWGEAPEGCRLILNHARAG